MIVTNCELALERRELDDILPWLSQDELWVVGEDGAVRKTGWSRGRARRFACKVAWRALHRESALGLEPPSSAWRALMAAKSGMLIEARKYAISAQRAADDMPCSVRDAVMSVGAAIMSDTPAIDACINSDGAAEHHGMEQEERVWRNKALTRMLA